MRKTEVLSMCQSDIDMDKRVAVLRNTKNRDTRTVPPSASASESLLSAIGNPIRPKDYELIFFGGPGANGIRRPYCFEKIGNELNKMLA